MHFPHLLLFKIISNYFYTRLHSSFLKIYHKKNLEKNKSLVEKLITVRVIPISTLIEDLDVNKDFAIVCIKPNDKLHASLLEYYELKEKYSNIKSQESKLSFESTFQNDIGNFRICLERLNQISSSTNIFQILVNLFSL